MGLIDSLRKRRKNPVTDALAQGARGFAETASPIGLPSPREALDNTATIMGLLFGVPAAYDKAGAGMDAMGQGITSMAQHPGELLRSIGQGIKNNPAYTGGALLGMALPGGDDINNLIKMSAKEFKAEQIVQRKLVEGYEGKATSKPLFTREQALANRRAVRSGMKSAEEYALDAKSLPDKYLATILGSTDITKELTPDDASWWKSLNDEAARRGIKPDISDQLHELHEGKPGDISTPFRNEGEKQYHGTIFEFRDEDIKPSGTGYLGPGIYTSHDTEIVNSYAGMGEHPGKRVIQFHRDPKAKVVDVTDKIPPGMLEDLRATIKERLGSKDINVRRNAEYANQQLNNTIDNIYDGHSNDLNFYDIVNSATYGMERSQYFDMMKKYGVDAMTDGHIHVTLNKDILKKPGEAPPKIWTREERGAEMLKNAGIPDSPKHPLQEYVDLLNQHATTKDFPAGSALWKNGHRVVLTNRGWMFDPSPPKFEMQNIGGGHIKLPLPTPEIKQRIKAEVQYSSPDRALQIIMSEVGVDEKIAKFWIAKDIFPRMAAGTAKPEEVVWFNLYSMGRGKKAP